MKNTSDLTYRISITIISADIYVWAIHLYLHKDLFYLCFE